MKKFFIRWLIYFVTIFIVANFLGLMEVEEPGTLVIAALVLGILNAWIRPVLIFITLPLNIITLGLFVLIINVFLLWLTAALVPGMAVHGFWYTLLASILISIISSILNWLITEDRKFRMRVYR